MGDDIIENYMPRIENGRFYPLTVIDANGDVIGHLIKMPIGTWNCTDMELHIGGTR